MSTGQIMLTGGGVFVPVTAYTNDGGQGDRTSIITVTQSMTLNDQGTPGLIVEGGAPGAGDYNFDFNISLVSDEDITFEFQEPKYIDEFLFRFTFGGSGNSGLGAGNYKVRASNNDVDYVDVSASFTTGSSVDKVVSGINLDARGYLYYQIYFIDDALLSNDFFKAEFKIAQGAI